MPFTPASTQTATASITRGILPPREFRTVAILLTFTDRQIMNVINVASGHLVIDWSLNDQTTRRLGAQIRRHGVHDFLGPGANFVLVLSFQHDAQEWLRPRIA